MTMSWVSNPTSRLEGEELMVEPPCSEAMTTIENRADGFWRVEVVVARDGLEPAVCCILEGWSRGEEGGSRGRE